MSRTWPWFAKLRDDISRSVDSKYHRSGFGEIHSALTSRIYTRHMAGSDSREIERKYAVTDSRPIPSLVSLPGIARVQRPRVFTLEAVYFDTMELSLDEQHITLRRRTGGDDAGWHLKLPVSADERSEVHEPLGTDPELVPARLRRIVAVYTRGHALGPEVRLSTRRTVRRLLGPNDEILGLFCDDEVEAVRLVPSPLSQSWREWELELVDGDSSLLDATDALFAATGVLRSDSPSKLAHALGVRELRRSLPAPPSPRSAGELLVAAFADYRRELVCQDPRVREELPDAVHRMRVAVARMRAAIATFRPLLNDEAQSRIRPELSWIGHSLGAARDTEVMIAWAASVLQSERADLLLGPIADRMERQLRLDSDEARSVLRDALDSSRYFRLLDSVDALASGELLTSQADARAKDALPELVNRRIARLRTAMHSADKARDPSQHDLALHEVRKEAKKVRYAAQLISPLRPKRTKRLATAATAIQEVLGTHQDSVVARQALLRLSTAAGDAGEDTFTYGRLHALEQTRAEDSEVEYERTLRRIPESLDTA